MTATYDVRIDVDAGASRGAYRPLWNWWGYDEPNYTDTANGKKLLKDGPIATRELMKAADIWAAGINRDLNTSSMTELQKVAGADLKPLPADQGNTGGAPAHKP